MLLIAATSAGLGTLIHSGAGKVKDFILGIVGFFVLVALIIATIFAFSAVMRLLRKL